MSYYKYAERDASNQVNWSEITSNMVKSLKDAEAIRESKRQAINDATAELGTTLSEAPQGEHKGLNEFAMTYANNAQQMRLMQDKLLKSGQLSLKDYNIGRANLTEGTTQLFSLGKKYQAVYADRMKKFQDGTTSQLDADMLARLEGFANFSNHEAYINPTNGQVSMGKLVDKTIDGKTVKTMDKTPGSFTTIQQLNFSLGQEIQKYQMNGLDAEVKKFAKTYLTTDGPYQTLDDIRQVPEYDKMVNDIVSSQLVMPNSVGSILKDYIGGYDTVFNKKDQGDKSILMVEDPRQPGSGRMIMDVTSKEGKKHKEVAEEYLKRQIEKQLGRKETQKEKPRATATETITKTKLKDDTLAMTNIGDLYFAKNKGQVNAAASFLEGIKGNQVRSIQKTKVGDDYSIEVIFDDGTTGSYPLTIDGVPVDPKTFVESISSSLVPGMKDIDKVMEQTKNLRGKTSEDFKSVTGGFERKLPPKPAEVDPILSRNVFLENLTGTTEDGEKISLKDFKGDDVRFVKLFSPLFNQMGLFIDDVDFGSNTVQVKDSKGTELARIPTNDNNSGVMITEFIKGYLKNVKGGVLEELLTQGVIPKMTRGKTKKSEATTDADKPDNTLKKTKEDCPGNWDEVMQRCR